MLSPTPAPMWPRWPQVEGEAQRKQRMAAEAQEKVDDLAEENVELKARQLCSGAAEQSYGG